LNNHKRIKWNSKVNRVKMKTKWTRMVTSLNKVKILQRQNLAFCWWQKRRSTLAQSVLKHLAPSTVFSVTDSVVGRLARSTNVPIVT